jgi:hypothetical protein
MKRQILLIVAVAVFVLPACPQRGREGTVEGPHGEKLSLGVPEKVSLSQGGEKKFTISVNRENLEGPVQITFGDLPAGVTVADKEMTMPEGKNQIFVTMKAEEDSPPVQKTPIKVTAALGELKTSKKFNLYLSESVERKAKLQEAYANEIDKRLEEVKQKLELAQKKIMDLKDEETHAELQKQVGERSEQLRLAREKYNQLVTTTAETWERHRAEMENYARSVEKNTEQLLDRVKKGN